MLPWPGLTVGAFQWIGQSLSPVLALYDPFGVDVPLNGDTTTTTTINNKKKNNTQQGVTIRALRWAVPVH